MASTAANLSQHRLLTREDLEDGDIFLHCLLSYLAREGNTSTVAVEIYGGQVIAHVLLVERVLGPSGCVRLLVPVSTAVGREDLVTNKENAFQHSHLKLGVGKDYSISLSVLDGHLEKRQGGLLHVFVFESLLLHELLSFLLGDILVMYPIFGLGRRGEYDLFELAAVLNALLQLVSAHFSRLFIVFKSRSREICPADRLDWDHLKLAHEHRSTLKDLLVLLDFLWHLVDVAGDHVILDAGFLLQKIEPKF
mmetsp:Transcript_16375/g.25942  ORF Transcript_16375/g.25942 Transcript_16375/m.25942 type:complete len:251 (-) Transcript_16375:315-1067(-)